MVEDYDVAIVGAGAAGLSAAREAARAGASAIVLEARDRIGGRAYTRFDPGCGTPIELGAEFIHGDSAEVFELLRIAGSNAIEQSGASYAFADGGFHAAGDEPFEEAAVALRRYRTDGPDCSVDDFIRAEAQRGTGARALDRLRMLVEGFDAADPADASMRAVAEEWHGEAGIESSQYRPLGGYRQLLDALARRLPADRVTLRLETPVTSLAWSRGGVRLRAKTGGAEIAVRARCAIVTVPAGVLHSGTPSFDPPLPQEHRHALRAIAMGPVTKAVLHFEDPFWRDVQRGNLRDASFFTAQGTRFPTFWTTYPVVSPLLTAWAGGPRSQRFAGESPEAVTAAALDDLALLFGIGVHTLREKLVAAHVHDWQRDPYALGAYSYVRTGGSGARAALSQPLEDTVYISGEAVAEHGEGGTVGGALRAGATAARAALRSARTRGASAE